MRGESQRIVYRVTFEGREDDLVGDEARAALSAAGAAWEGSEHCPQRASKHRALIQASTEQGAITALRRLLAAHGSFDEFAASPVFDSCGEIWQGPFPCTWDEVDWQADARLARLTELQRAVLGSLFNDAEPTWIIPTDRNVPADRATVEPLLEDLQRQGLVRCALADAFEPGEESKLDRWWAMTDECWDLLGLIKSPRYASWLE